MTEDFGDWRDALTNAIARLIAKWVVEDHDPPCIEMAMILIDTIEAELERHK